MSKDAPSSEAHAAAADEINALLDGELPHADEHALLDRLTEDAAGRALLKSLMLQRAALHATFVLPDACPRTRALVADWLKAPGGNPDADLLE